MQKNLKIPSLWSQLALFLMLYSAGWILAQIAGGVILGARLGLNNLRDIDPSDPKITGTLKLIQALSTLLLFGVTAFVSAWRTFSDRPLYHLGFRPAYKKNFYILAVLLLLFSIPFEGWLGQLNKAIPLTESMMRSEREADKQIAAFLKAGSPLDVVINVFIMALLPAIFEEACFRGVLQRILIGLCRSPWAGIIITAILFSALHFQFEGFLPRMFLGALLGAIYWYSGSLWASILAHFFTNGIQVVAAMYYPRFITENPSVPVFTALISLVIVVGLLAVLRKQSTVRYDQVYPI
jgi:membrane protease YdiL (CAAX protease family)